MKTTTKLLERWWRVPLLLLVCLLGGSSPTRAGDISGTDFYWHYVMSGMTYDSSKAMIDFKMCFFNDYGTDEGYMKAQGGLNIYASKDGGSSWQKIINISTDASHNLFAKDQFTGCDLGGTPFKWDEKGVSYTYKDSYHTHINWYLPLQWRNCFIKFKCDGTWCDADGTSNRHHINNLNGEGVVGPGHVREIYTPYAFTVRDLYWDGDYSISPDGTVTIPYKFGSTAGNTDGETAIWTRINGSWTGNIAKKEPGTNFNPGTYTFKLKDIGKDFRSDDFTVEPYHEFKHYNDKDNNNGEKCYQKFAGTKTIYKLPKATDLSATFVQDDNKVTLTWSSDHPNYSTGNWGTKWAIYRNGSYLASVLQDNNNNPNYNKSSKIYTFIDDNCPNQESVKYEIYYIWIDWDEEKTKVDDLKSDPVTVNTTLKVPVNNLASTSSADRVTLTWTSDSHKAGWGHEFRIFVDNETSPIYTVTPSGGQTSFTWVHRTTDKHDNRESGVENGIPYTEEPLNVCSPHDYRVESWVNNQKISEAKLSKRAIGNGTLFYSLDATKGVYPGIVKLSWHVNLQGSTATKTYIVARRPAENEKATWETINSGITSREERVTYTDDTPLPGIYYEYQVTVIDQCSDGTKVTNDATTIGFAQTTGTISGRITFGSAGTAVAGVDVEAKQSGSSAASDASQYHAKHFTSTEGAVKWEYPTSSYGEEKFRGADFSIQMWINPDELCDSWILRLKGSNIGLGIHSDGELLFGDGKGDRPFGLYLKQGKYSHVTLTRKGRTVTCYLIEFDENGNPEMKKGTGTINSYYLHVGSSITNWTYEYCLTMAGSTDLTLGYFNGYVDDFRLWTKCLTEDEIKENYDHVLVGNESGLETYWTFDEGLKNYFFDSSREGTTYHNHHGVKVSNADPTTTTPKQLKLKAKTDLDGNYIIQGVPFSGEGTTYAIIPKLGIHEFNPTQQLRFVSNNSLVHNSTDFTDVSSFPVKGTVYYSGTTYPVEGVNFYVDGTACTKDGAMVTTNSYGEFTISVPIGKHFIQAKMNGHVFVNDGRYPPDPNQIDSLHNFDRAITGLEFRDTTLVNFTGRIVGGDIEGNKPVGFAQSQNNIGVTRFTLTAMNTSPFLNAVKKKISDTSFEYIPNPDEATVPSATDQIQSHSWRGASIDECHNIYIETDPGTGEFSAMLPPLEYAIGDMMVNSTGDKVGGNVTIDLSNPQREFSDTLHAESGDVLYTYNTKLVQAFHSDPVFTVSQKDRSDGLFGINSVKYKDALGDTVINIIDKGSYVHKYPMFKQGETYIFKLEGYEQYENHDKSATQPVVTKVPLKNTVVTIDNSLSNEQAVFLVSGEVTLEDGTTTTAREGQVYNLKSNQLQLNESGCADYKWKAGLPNVAGDFTRTIAMTYDINGKQYPWDGSGIKGVILGDLPTGNNFVTSGPDKLDMILRDPPGTGSSAEWSTGTVKTLTTLTNDTWSETFDIGVTFKFGHELKTLEGTAVGTGSAQILATSVEHETVDDLTTHAIEENSGENGETIETTISITKAFATSEEPDYVGAYGDIYIGQATNIVFGNARNVGFKRNGSEFDLGLKDVIATSLLGATTFAYTQGYIEDYLLPNFEKIRRKLLQTTTQDSINSYSPVNGVGMHNLGNSKGNLYFTTKTPDDENFGADGTYTVIIPQLSKEIPDSVKSDNTKLFQWCVKEKQCTTDSIKWINQQISNWKKHLEFNEREKVRAFELRNNKDSVKYENYSFNGGASYSYSVEKDSTHTSSWDWTVSAGVLVADNAGEFFQKWGIEFDAEMTATGGRHEAQDSINSYTSSFSYTLAEEGNDALTVDVYEYGAFGPIFRTRGGQTSNPYEGEVRTQYYLVDNKKPVIMDATMRIEVPQIDVDVNTVSDIPTGSAANYTLRLGNASEIGADVAYKLFFLDETNPYGAQLTMDGKALTAEGRLIKVPGNQTLTKMLQLRQSDTSILNYIGNDDPNHELYEKGIGIVFASESQPEDIADTIFIKAYFTPSSSAVDLALSNKTLNTQTGSDLTLTFSGFDRNYHNLKAFRLEYKAEGADWTQLQEYVINEADTTSTNELLPKGATVSYTLPMSAWSDGNYLFRVVSAATYGNGEVYRYSDELPLVKDMQKPRPMGQPEPADGILDIGDNVSITFNETFVKGELTKANNFTVTGVLNGAEIAHETALSVNGGSSTVAAQTEASINLANKDFSIDAWVNINGAGTLLSHGQGSNKLTVGTDSEGKLVVTIADNTYTSTNCVPMDDWTFLTMNVTADGKLNASVATANETKKLFTAKEVAAYAGNGPLSVGCGAAAAMHELLLWDEAHDLTTALANRSKSKVPSTRHLIGYWKMNEGEGKTIRDYARSRNMVMPDETWYLNNENKAISLDGNHYVSINAATLPISEYDDYAVEFWMRGNQQTGEAQLLQMGDVALWLNADGELQLTGKGAASKTADPDSQFSILNSKLTDNAWHHVALNVLRQGAAAVYVDGERCLTTNAANVGGINGDKLVLGVRRTYDATVGGTDNYTYDHPFKGEMDEVRVWGATMNGDLIAKNHKVRFTGTEGGLIAYYPFETKTLDSSNQVVTLGTDSCFTGGNIKAQLISITSSTPQLLNYTDYAPALREKPSETNVNFTYVANDEKIVIEIDEDPATIEGTTLNFNVRYLRDLNGNYSAPAVWSAFVNRNELVWADDALSVTQHVETGSSVTATIVNKGGKQQMWTLDGMPAWLTASAEYGTTNPLEETKVTFTVSPSTPIGKYEETIYLKGNDGIEAPLTINVKVTGDEPLWSVNVGDYEESMNLIGALDILGVPSEDEDDLVGAFINDECCGVAHPKYIKKYDSYFVTMDIYNNSSDDKNAPAPEVEFKVYDASTGIIYPVVTTSEPVAWVANDFLGRYKTPVIISATDMIEQSIDLENGWNWMSLGVTPETFTVPVVFENANGKVLTVKSQSNGTVTYSGNQWVAKQEKLAMNNREMYVVKTSEPLTLTVTGRRVKPTEVPITVKYGWNWLGYNGMKTASLTEALSGLGPQDGDIIKGQRGVAYFDDSEWIGSLSTLVPGLGYKIQSVASDDRTFSYPSATSVAGARRAMPDSQLSTLNPQPSTFTPVDYSNYPANMVLIAQVVADGQPVSGVELGVFASVESEESVVDYECREAAVTDERGLVYITIPGDEPCELTFRVAINGQWSMVNSQSITYETDAVIGTPKAPFIIDLDNATGIADNIRETINNNGDVYDLQGRKIVNRESVNRKLRKGVYIVNGQKQVK